MIIAEEKSVDSKKNHCVKEERHTSLLTPLAVTYLSEGQMNKPKFFF